MEPDRTSGEASQVDPREGVTAISVQCFKSHAETNRLNIRPLTVLAGANSSGKSSIVQPLLLMKQTLEATYDPGPLLLNGPNVQFTSVDQLLCRTLRGVDEQRFIFGIEKHQSEVLKTEFAPSSKHNPELRSMSIGLSRRSHALLLTPNQDSTILERNLAKFLAVLGDRSFRVSDGYKLATSRIRCFLYIVEVAEHMSEHPFAPTSLTHLLHMMPTLDLIRMIHVPGWRGNPERVFSRTASSSIPDYSHVDGVEHSLDLYPGTFEEYMATVVADWQSNEDDRLGHLGTMLADLGLTREVSAHRVNGTQIELRVGRLLKADSHGSDLVDIADVGLGVSQVLPVLVALLVAERGQLVYIEQPELHLHPRAQYELARIMAVTARRGVKLLVETHSALLLLQFQRLIASGHLDPDFVALHWFSRHPENGTTSIHTADVDECGAVGDWPEDFGEVEMMAESGYLDAVEERNRA